MRRYINILGLMLLLPLFGTAQTDTTEPYEDVILEETEIVAPSRDNVVPQPRPEPEPIVMRKVDPENWDKSTRGIDYSKDVPKKKREKKADNSKDPVDYSTRTSHTDWTAGTQALGTIFQVVMVALLIGLIAWGIYAMMGAPKNRQVTRDGVEITLENLEEHLHETDLERFLRAALADGNYALAVRLYYLQILKDLSAKGAIKWAKEKTNRDYQREMRQHQLGAPFRAATLVYEKVWYGNQPIDKAGFALLEPDFKNLLQVI